ncbi:MAG: flagellar biosynthesis protein FlhA [Rhodobacteraceae bacterium]|nr:flagellar biosynthesis protein FlhA [Paracoccaceae bacterium]
MPSNLTIHSLYHPTVLLALALMTVIVMMILPVPAILLDIGFAVSFALAILIFTTTLFVERPLDFSAFPTILLASLMLRLSLNVSSTKLIIGEGHTGPDAAGGVIQGFALFIMGGNIFLGLVVFCVLLIVNFIVITKGAGRMAEVGARFALDGMPGKQLAIDSDLAAGAITHEEAKQRRKIEQEETTFFGSLDGASKFVKGDAIAGLLITLLNLLMGIAMGMGWHGLGFGAAIETYAMLTVGDGLVSQIPAVIISIAAALLLSKGGVLGAADQAMIKQLSAHPAALITVGVLMALFALAPGLPFLPFIAGAGALIAGGWWAHTTKEKETQAAKLEAAAEARAEEQKPTNTLGDLIDVDEVHVEFAPDLIALAMEENSGLASRITNMRRHIATEFGFIMPEVRLTDNTMLEPGRYDIRIQGVKCAGDTLRPGKVLTLTSDDTPLEITGEDVKEPVYGAAARWIPEAKQEEAALLGLPVVTPVEVVATHLLETVQRHFARLLTRRALKKLLDEFVTPSDQARAEANKQILDDFVPDKVSLDLLQAVLRHLLDERVPVRNLPLILEAIAEARPSLSAPEAIADYVRQRIGFILVSKLLDDSGSLPLVQLNPEWETIFTQHQTSEEPNADIALPPTEFNRLATAVRDRLASASQDGRYPAIVTTTRRRRFVREVLSAKGISNPVLSFEEIGAHVRPTVLGMA